MTVIRLGVADPPVCHESAAMANADSRTTSGTVPLWRRDTAPSRPGQTHLPEPTEASFRREGGAAVEDTVSPPRSASARERSSDVNITRLSVPLPVMVTVIGIALAIAAGLWRLDARMGAI